jgi:hypothetical protein
MTRLTSLTRITAAVVLLAVSAASAAALTVTNTNNNGAGSLNQAITDANTIGGINTITFDLPGSGPHIIELTSPLPAFFSDIQIINDDTGAEAVTVRRSAGGGTENFRIFTITPTRTVLIAGLTISNGDPGINGFFGGGIHNDKSTLTVRNCTLSGNRAVYGGGIHNSTLSGDGTATLTLINCTFSGNSATDGGAVQNQSSGGNATVSLTNCILTGNSASTNGGGINNVSSVNTASITLNNCVVSDNSADSGGGITSRSAGGTTIVVANDCTSTGNQATAPFGAGGGIRLEAGGSLTVTNSTLTANSAGSGGAIALENGGPTVALDNSTMSLNNAIFSGGALYSEGGGVIVTNCTISGNAVSSGNGSGGGIFNEGSGHDLGRVDIINSTIAGNAAATGGGIRNSGFVSPANTIMTLVNTVLRTGQTGSNIVSNGGASFTSLGHNLSNDSADGDAGSGPGGLLNAAGDIRNTDPQLGPLASNGGPTQTHALLPASLAINGGDEAHAPSLDQRGFPRVGVSDIGSFELQTVTPAVLGNISTRLRVETGDNGLIGGFIVTGTQPKRIIVRALGPSLPLAGALADPVLELRNASGGLIMSCNDWRDDPAQESEIIATGIPPGNDLESAIVATLPANGSAYTAIVRGANNGTGIGVVEAYDLDQAANSKLANISTRGLVQTGDDVLIGGLIVLGQNPLRVIVRALGPSLPLAGALDNPTLELRDGSGTLLVSNDNWRDDPGQESEIIATGIPPANDLESAIVRNLTPGNYTAIVRGVNNTTGIAVVEAYGLN